METGRGMEVESKEEAATERERKGLKIRPLKRCMTDMFGGKQNLSVFSPTQPLCDITTREFSFRLNTCVQVLHLCTMYHIIPSQYLKAHTFCEKAKQKNVFYVSIKPNAALVKLQWDY